MTGAEDWMVTRFLIAWGLKVVAAGLILVIGNWLAKKAGALFVALMDRNDIDVTLTKFLRNIIYYALLAAVVIAAAGQLGINTTSFLTVVGAAGLAVGLALKDSLANFSSGVMLILFRPFKVGDFVTVGGESGTVEEITVFSTIMNTPDNQKKIIPNGQISNNTITNVTANKTRRIDLVIGISYDDNIKDAEKVLWDVVKADSRILAEPETSIAVSELADSSVNFVVRPWVKTGDYWSTRFALIQNFKLALDEAGITIPYPQQDVYMHQAGADGAEQ